MLELCTTLTRRSPKRDSREFAAHGDLPLSADIYLTPEDGEIVLQRGTYGQGAVKVRGIKMYMDGALGSRGAALLAPYSDAPSSGLLVTPIEQIRATLQRAREKNVQITTHAIGDRGNRLVLDAYRDAFAGNPEALRAARWRIEHAQVIARDGPTLRRAGVIASMQPPPRSDLTSLPRARSASLAAPGLLFLPPPARCSRRHRCSGGESYPLIEFYAATYRRDSPASPSEWHLRAVSRAEALRMLTASAAFGRSLKTAGHN